MELLKSIPSWVWALLFIVALVFVYGIFNRRWLEEERREAEAQKKPPADEPQGERKRAAELHVGNEDNHDKGEADPPG